MTLGELIEKVKTEKPNSFRYEYLTRIVNDVEAMIYDYLETKPENREVYSWPEDKDVKLVAPAPYDCLYESYLKAQLDYANEEYDLYDVNQEQFTLDMESFRAYAMRKGLVDTSDLPQQIKNWW